MPSLIGPASAARRSIAKCRPARFPRRSASRRAVPAGASLRSTCGCETRCLLGCG